MRRRREEVPLGVVERSESEERRLMATLVEAAGDTSLAECVGEEPSLLLGSLGSLAPSVSEEGWGLLE